MTLMESSRAHIRHETTWTPERFAPGVCQDRELILERTP